MPTIIARLTYRDNWIRAIIAFCMVITVALSIIHADLIRTYELQPVLIASAASGFTAGILLAISQFPSLTAHIYSLIYGTFSVTVIIGLQLTEHIEWRDRVVDMLMRQIDWTLKAFDGGSSRDALIFVIHTGMIMWFLGYSAAWVTIRSKHTWRAIFPGALVILSIVYYYFGPHPLPIYLALYCVLSLVYLSLSHLANHKETWLLKQVRYDDAITGVFIRSTLVISLIAMLVAWSLPTMAANPRIGEAISNVDEPWQEVRNQWQRMFSALNSQTSTAADPQRDRLTLGGARNPGDSPVMDVSIDADLPYVYWRSYVYDTYHDDGRWDAVKGQETAQEAGEKILFDDTRANRVFVNQSFLNLASNVATMYAAPDFVQTDRPVTISTADGEVVHVRSRYRLNLGDRYNVISQINFSDEATLRQASTQYPDKISKPYTQLPTVITDRTKALSTELTAGYNNPYDKAIAVQNYLRTTITYDDQIDAPPNNVEAIDYFLFDTQTGYCNYYAAAFTILLRLQGIPTRISSGYASGEYNQENQTYRVRARDAHTWPEVYFPDHGWIQFEPTVIIEPPERDAGETIDENLYPTPEAVPEDEINEEGLLNAPTPTPPLSDENDDDRIIPPSLTPETTNQPQEREITYWIQAAGAFLLISLSIGLMIIGWKVNQQIEEGVDSSYGRLGLWAKWLQLAIRPSHTPSERAVIMGTAIPDGKKRINHIIGEYTHRQYSPDKDKQPLFNLQEEWRTLRPLLFKKMMRNFLRR